MARYCGWAGWDWAGWDWAGSDWPTSLSRRPEMLVRSKTHWTGESTAAAKGRSVTGRS
jgi:hypothetical protein